MNKKETIIYLAGFFDGEGSIHILCTMTLIISVSNTNLKVINMFKKEFQGHTVLKKIHPGRCTGYSYRISGIKACNALEKMIPYLVVKRGEAKVGISIKNTLQVKGKVRRLTSQEYNLRKKARLKLFGIRDKNSPNRTFNLRKY